MKSSNFKHTALRLAGLYMLILILISLVFSVWLYTVSVNQVRRGVLGPPGPIEQSLRRDNRRLAIERQIAQEEAIENTRQTVLTQIIVFNSFLIVFGSLSSYYLARRTLRPIEEAHTSLLRFTADASHELRTPITAMRLENEVALSDPKLTLQQAKKQLSSTIEELDSLTGLTEKLLSLARLDGIKLTKKQQTIKPIVLDAIRTIQPHADAKRQTISSKITHFQAYVHAESLKNALIILLDNAVKYSPEKSEISLKATKQSKQFCISIADSGIGIDAEALPHIFERFYRADSSRSKNAVTGHGVGLSLALNYIEAQGGTITVESTPQKGSTFTIQLPLR